MLRKIAYGLALVLLCSNGAVAQKKVGTAPKAPKLVIDSFIHDFGVVKPGEPLTYSFKVKNAGSADLQIVSVSPG